MRIEVIVGLILVIDGIISIVFASPSRVTLNIFNINSNNLVYIGHFFRAVRIILGLLFIFFSDKIIGYNLFIGAYFLLDSFSSILTSSSFKAVDDYLRISRALIGGYLISSPLFRK